MITVIDERTSKKTTTRRKADIQHYLLIYSAPLVKVENKVYRNEKRNG